MSQSGGGLACRLAVSRRQDVDVGTEVLPGGMAMEASQSSSIEPLAMTDRKSSVRMRP